MYFIIEIDRIYVNNVLAIIALISDHFAYFVRAKKIRVREKIEFPINLVWMYFARTFCKLSI